MKSGRYFLLLAVTAVLAVVLPSRPSLAQEEPVCESDVIVQEGDWLSTIAEGAYGDPMLYQAIASATNLKAQSDGSYATIDNPDLIEPGWKLCVPSLADAQALVDSALAAASPTGLTVEQLENATYSGIGLDEQLITLTGGEYESEPLAPDSDIRQRVVMVPYGVRYGDLNGDGADDAVVFLSENSGGTGDFIYIAAQLNQAGQPVDAGSVWIEDRIQIISVAIEDGQAVLEVTAEGPGDAACCKSYRTQKTYALQDGQLTELPGADETLVKLSAADLNGTSWTLVDLNLDQQPVLADTEVTLNFADGQISGSGGCNSYTADFSPDDPAVLSISPVAATSMACAEPILDQETAYFTALENAAQWGYLIGWLAIYYATDEPGYNALVFEPAAAPPAMDEGAESIAGTEATAADMLTASTWQWVRLTDPVQQFDVDDPENYTLTFQPDETLQIKADCNQVIASYSASDDGALSIQPGPATMAACPPGSRGEEFVQKLGFAAGYFFQDGNLFIDMMADGGTMEFSPQTAPSQANAGVTATEVITFVPTEIPTDTQPGSCFASAIGLGRDDAYRCTVGNQIYDPCFVVDDTPTVVCGANLATGETGFVLELTEPLPEPDAGDLAQPWLIELADGQVCGLMTGTVVGVDDRIAPYGCPDRSYLFEDFQQGEVWLAEKAVIGLNDNGYFVEDSEMVPIRTVWQ